MTLTRDVSCGGGGIAHGAVHYVSERPAKGHAVAQVGLLKQQKQQRLQDTFVLLALNSQNA